MSRNDVEAKHQGGVYRRRPALVEPRPTPGVPELLQACRRLTLAEVSCQEKSLKKVAKIFFTVGVSLPRLQASAAFLTTSACVG